MKKYTNNWILALIFALTFVKISVGQQTESKSVRNWSGYFAPLKITSADSVYLQQFPFSYNCEKGKTEELNYSECGEDLGGYFSFPGFGVQNSYSGDVRISEFGMHGAEISVAVDPNDKYRLWECNMSITGVNPPLLSCYNSSDRGITWSPTTSPVGNGISDPTGYIDKNGNFYVCYLQNVFYSGAVYLVKYDNTAGWQEPLLIQEPETSEYGFDKPFLTLDESLPSSILYCAWSPRRGEGNPPIIDGSIEIARSEDDGSTWTDKQIISKEIYSGNEPTTFHNGANIQIGPNGEVYVAWVCYDITTDPGLGNNPETGIVFVHSIDHGVTYQGDNDDKGYLIRSIHGLANYANEHYPWILTYRNLNSFPSMCVDNSNGPYRGRIYIAWANYGPIEEPPDYNGENIFTYVIFSDEQGAPGSWSDPVRINDVGTYSAYVAQAFYPWISCDDETGALSLVYYWYNSESMNNNTFTVNVAMSRDFGLTWENARIGDYNLFGSSLFYGDYIGITSKRGIVYPTFSDARMMYGENLCLPQVYISPYYAWNCVDHYPDNTIDPANSIHQIINKGLIRKWEAEQYIHSRNRIMDDGVAVFNAGTEIRLLPGENPFNQGIPEFHAYHGSFVHAYIEGCVPFEGNESNNSNDFKKVKHITGIQDINLEVNSYPNPTSGKISFQANRPGVKNWDIEIKTSAGIPVFQKKSENKSTVTLDISCFPKGLYFVTIKIDGNIIVKKIILI